MPQMTTEYFFYRTHCLLRLANESDDKQVILRDGFFYPTPHTNNGLLLTTVLSSPEPKAQGELL